MHYEGEKQKIRVAILFQFSEIKIIEYSVRFLFDYYTKNKKNKKRYGNLIENPNTFIYLHFIIIALRRNENQFQK